MSEPIGVEATAVLAVVIESFYQNTGKRANTIFVSEEFMHSLEAELDEEYTKCVDAYDDKTGQRTSPVTQFNTCEIIEVEKLFRQSHVHTVVDRLPDLDSRR